jgi:hypothetical protein
MSASIRSVEGYAIVSADGMIADASGVMPDSLKFEADQRFFERGLDGADVVIHGRHSQEQQPHSDRRHRLILTHSVATTAPDPANPKALFWNPAGLPLEDALAALGTPDARIGIVGGTGVFGMFLPRYDAFHLTHAPGVRLPNGRPVFPQVPAQTPEAVLMAHGLTPAAPVVLDRASGLNVVTWRH